VWRARHPVWGDVAVRLPALAVESTPNDPHVDTGELLRHEALVYSTLPASGIPVPRLYDLRHYEVDVLISEYVTTDGGGFNPLDLGGILARLHAAPVPAGVAPARSAAAFPTTIAERVTRRWSVLRDLTPGGLATLPPADTLASMIPESAATSLLHLDVRAPNVLAAGGRIGALVDWSNSMVGDPVLELARAFLYSLLPDNGIEYLFLMAGYQQVRPLPRCSDACWSLYHLDAAVMLAIVFTCEAPDPARARVMVDRANRYAQSVRWHAGRT
jgi:aminoglycoside phosphotransferase (APT) family kinase protein